MGAKVTFLLTTAEYTQWIRAPDVQHFLKKVREFHIEAACQIKNRFLIGDPVVEMPVIEPNVSHAKFPSLVPLAARFPNIVPQAELQTSDDEWHMLSVESPPFDHTDIVPEEFTFY